MTFFINYDPNMGLSINTYRNIGYCNEDISGLVEDIQNECFGCCPLEGALATLEDGGYWEGTNATQEILEELHILITEFLKDRAVF